MKHKIPPLLVFLIVVAAFSQATRELPEMSMEEFLNFEISTASKYDQAISVTPATAYVFTAQDFQQNGCRYLSDILRYIPNMEVHWSGGPQYVVETKLRGLEEYAVLMDGVLLNPASSVPPHFGYVLPLNHVKRVEVVMGPGSALYGADACAGVINIITTDPGPETAYQVSAYGGTQGLAGAQALVQHPLGPLGLQFSLSGTRINDNDRSWWPYLGEAYAAYPAGVSENYETAYDNKITSVAASGKVISGDNIVGFNIWNREADGGLRLDPASFAANRFARTAAYQYMVYFQNQTPLSFRYMLRSRLAYDYYQLRHNFYYTKRNINDPIFYRESADRFHWLEELDYRLTAHTRLFFGLEAQSIASVPKAYNPITDSTGLETGFGEAISDKGPLTYYHIRNGGLFLQAENTLLRDRLTINLGIRSDYYSTFGLSVNPRVSAYYKMAPNTSVRLMCGTAFSPPPPDKAYRTAYVPGQYYQTANEGLKPRNNVNFEAAVDHTPFSRLFLGMRVFRNDVKDDIVLVNTGSPYAAGADTVYQYQNTGKARYEGAEVLARVWMPLKITAQSGISYLNGYTQTDLYSVKKNLESLSRIKATWGINRTFFKLVNAGMQGLHLLDRRVGADNPLYPQGIKMPDVFLLTLNLSINPVWRGLGGRLKIENALDKIWSDTPGTSPSAPPELPQSRRRISLEVNWQH